MRAIETAVSRQATMDAIERAAELGRRNRELAARAERMMRRGEQD